MTRLPAAILCLILMALSATAGDRGDRDRGANRQWDERERGQDRDRGRNRPGEFDYYALTLSWSPTYCEANGERGEPQCDGRRPYAFVLHGLWPQHERGWPERCWTKKRQWVSDTLIGSMLDIMPSRDLIIHEYRKHGTCSGLNPERYYETARKLFESVQIPARYISPTQPITVTPGQIEEDFLKTNPQLTPDMISIACGRQRRLRELRICFSRDLSPRACGRNEDQRRLCSLDQVVMPPVRGGMPRDQRPEPPRDRTPGVRI